MCPIFMVYMLKHHVNSSEVKEELHQILLRYLRDEIGKPEVHPSTTDPSRISAPTLTPRPSAAQLEAQLLRAAGRHACRRALKDLRPLFDYVLRCDPLVEPRDYSKARRSSLVAARHCLTADDLRKMGGGRAAEWAAPLEDCPDRI